MFLVQSSSANVPLKVVGMSAYDAEKTCLTISALEVVTIASPFALLLYMLEPIHLSTIYAITSSSSSSFQKEDTTLVFENTIRLYIQDIPHIPSTFL